MNHKQTWPQLAGTMHGTGPCTGDHAAGTCSGWVVRPEPASLSADAQITESGGAFTLVVTTSTGAGHWTSSPARLKADDWDSARDETAHILGCVVQAVLSATGRERHECHGRL